MTEADLMQQLARRIAAENVQSALAPVKQQLARELADDPSRPKSTFRSIPLGLYGELPTGIRSSWLFHLRAGLSHPAERHPNSIQRMFAFDAPGWFDVWDSGRWSSHLLEPGDDGLSIPADRWHCMPAQPNDWTVVSFHTVEPEALIEIVGDPLGGATAERQYLAP